jgi:cytochrome c oxidase cbb3-type subunit 3
MAKGKRVDEPTGTETVGHEWDGIEELNTPLPRWWLWSFYATIIWGVAYTVFFPAWPMLSRATAGVLGWSSRSQLERELSDIERERAPILLAISSTPTENIERDPKLLTAALEGGRAAFRVNCVQCHGSGAAGSKGYPNLNDDDWLWGGDVKSIEYSIDHGIRNPEHPETRMSQMPAFGRDGILQPNEISDLTAYVRAISGQRRADSSVRRGGPLYAANCAVCHGPTGSGNRSVGAPNLRDAIWLYGGDEASVRTSIEQARFGVMPRWNGKLDPATRKMLAVYVHSLGGGEGGKGQTGSR